MKFILKKIIVHHFIAISWKESSNKYRWFRYSDLFAGWFHSNSSSFSFIHHSSKRVIKYLQPKEGFNNVSNPPACKTEDDDELFSNGQLKASNSYTATLATTDIADAIPDKLEGFSNALPISVRRSIYDNAFEDDNDSEMASLDGVSDADPNDNSMNSLQNASSNSFARTLFNNTRRRMSGLVLSYNFLKGASGNQRRDST